MNKPTFTLGNSLIIFASLAMFISVMSLNASYSNIQSFTTVDLTEYTQLPAEINKPVTWINDNTQQTVETEPPEVVETDTSEVDGKLQKRVIVSSDIHYEKILTYASVPELLSEQVKLYWLIDGVKIDVTEREDFNVTFYDENSNNLIDKISWIIPHLSEQEFILEFDITVINPWEYGETGGEWIVYFNTTGIGTLNITKDELANQVLTFNYIKCGSETIYPELEEYSYIIENYNCSETAEISHTINEMPNEIFSLQFDFGNDVNNDVDFAYDPDPYADLDGDGILNGDEDLNGWLGEDPLSPDYKGNGCAFIANFLLDTDGDCLTNAFEASVTGTDQLNPDTDGDDTGATSCNDYDEVSDGDPSTNPLNPGDCPPGGGSNTAPTAADVQGTVNEDNNQIILNTSFVAFFDADGDGMTKIKITKLETVGDLKLAGGHVTLNQEITDSQLALGILIFTPLANQSGTNYDEIAFKVSDGTDYSTSAYNFSFNHNAVNDAPHFTVTPSDGGSVSSAPTNDNNELNFSATAYDVEGDTWTLLVCGHHDISGGNCASGVNGLGQSTATGSTVQATISLDSVKFNSVNWTSEGMHENDTAWYAFACDSNNACSVIDFHGTNVSQGSGVTGTPFSINNAPSVNDVKITSSAGSNHLAYTESTLTRGGTVTDPDGDSEGTSTYKWWKQTDATGSFVDITSSFTISLPGSTQFNKDDRIKLEYLPVDAHGYGGSEVNVSICGTATSCTYMDVLNSNPVAVNDEYNVDSGNSFTTTSGSSGNGVLYNGTDDSDPDPEDTISGGQLTVTIASQPTCELNDLVALSSVGAFTYDSDPTCTATTDSFTYTISDGDGGTDIGTVNIDITKSAEVGVSNSLGPSSLIFFNASETNGSTYPADGNNGTLLTEYVIYFTGNGSTIDLEIKADQPLTDSASNEILISHYKYINSSNSGINTSLTQTDYANSITETFVALAENLAAAANHTMYIKFFLTVPDATTAGNYSNTIIFRSNTA